MPRDGAAAVDPVAPAKLTALKLCEKLGSRIRYSGAKLSRKALEHIVLRLVLADAIRLYAATSRSTDLWVVTPCPHPLSFSLPPCTTRANPEVAGRDSPPQALHVHGRMPQREGSNSDD